LAIGLVNDPPERLTGLPGPYKFNHMVEYPLAGAAGSKPREELLDRVFSALAHSTRRRLVHLLAERERSVGELAAPFAMSLAAVSKHLAVLERAGLVRRRKRGRTHYCSLRPESLAGGMDWIGSFHPLRPRHFAPPAIA
jgi:DNA-binding transcriptional ArsR family regulator